MENEIIKFKQYFLGNLGNEKAEAIDLQIISDANLEENLHFAETELMEDYLDGTLSPAEIELFQKNFLVSPERKKQLAHLSLLRKYARNEARSKTFSKLPTISEETFRQKLRKMFSANLRPATAFLGLIIVGLAVIIGWRVLFYEAGANEIASLEKEFVELNKTDLSNLSEFKDFSNLNLISGTLRGGANNKNILLKENLTANVLFRLALTSEVNPDAVFKVEIVKDQKNVLPPSQIRSYKNQSGQEFRLLLPASLLTKGEYQIKIKNQAAQDADFVYSFLVQ